MAKIEKLHKPLDAKPDVGANPDEPIVERLKMVAVSSSNIQSVGYLNGQMYVQFKNGGLYRYDNVPNELYWRMRRASSVGRFFHRFIKQQPQYPWTRIW